MSERAPPRIYYILYPVEDVIVCEICNMNVREDARRQRGVFKAATRRKNYVHHLTRLHEVPTDNVKIRCSVCGRVSNKPSHTAWRDTQTHHRRRHAARLEAQPVEAVRKVVEMPLVPNEIVNPADVALQDLDKKKAAATLQRDIDSVDGQNKSRPKCSPIKNVGTRKITATIKQEPKAMLPNKSIIISGMGKMFDVVADNDPSQVLTHSTPSKRLQSVKASTIVPKARLPVKRLLSSQFEAASPRKRFQPAYPENDDLD